MKATAIIHLEGIEVSEFWKAKMRAAVKENGAPIRAYIETVLPESRKARGYLMGGLLPLWACLDGNDYRDSEILDHYFLVAKREFTPEAIKIHGKIELRGRSSKGSKALKNLTEKLIDMLVEEYGLSYDSEVLKTDNYKKFRDEIYNFGRWDCYLDYAKSLKWI